MSETPSINTEALYDTYLLTNYARSPLTVVRGEGDWVWDDQGNRYLDFTSGIAVNSLGHAHPLMLKRLKEQSETVGHCSNLFRHPWQGRLAEQIVQLAGPGRCLFVNSGTEANEALIKLARLHGQKLAGGQEAVCYEIIGAENAFHGRTFGGMSATPQEKIQRGFRPLVPGFRFGKLNDIDSFKRLVNEQTCAILLETIQGESGIHCCSPEFLQDIRQLCIEKNILLLLDEVQCGIGRTGKFFAFEHGGITPDAIGLAKGLGGGFPIGAIWVSEAHSDLFKPGSHGCTFGGSPLACTAALTVLEVLNADGFLHDITIRASAFKTELNALKYQFPEFIVDVRGKGFLLALEVKDPALVQAAFRKNGLLCPLAGSNVIRLLPALTVADTSLTHAIELMRNSFDQLQKGTVAP
jgi:acetylornithine aminotransferase/acetylornithine/N-succinyldiaminopimelate aminotransferase